MKRLAVLCLFLGVFALAPHAGHALMSPDEMLDDPALEAKAREVTKQLRCVVCQNQSIDDSEAPLARDMRLIVLERIAEGYAPDQVMGYMVDRYGDYVLLRPPFKPVTYALWIGPGLLFLAGALVLWTYLRRLHARAERVAEAAPLSAAEKRRLKALLDEEGG